MTDSAKFLAGAAIGVVVAAVLAAALLDVNLGGNTETGVTLTTVGTDPTCTLGKSTYVRAKKDKQVIWEIDNYCGGTARTVTVGNFRATSGPSGANNCDAAGAEYPFTDADLTARSVTVDPASDGGKSEGRIKLKVKGRGDLGENELTYYFDICLDGKVSDPILMIER